MRVARALCVHCVLLLLLRHDAGPTRGMYVRMMCTLRKEQEERHHHRCHRRRRCCCCSPCCEWRVICDANRAYGTQSNSSNNDDAGPNHNITPSGNNSYWIMYKRSGEEPGIHHLINDIRSDSLEYEGKTLEYKQHTFHSKHCKILGVLCPNPHRRPRRGRL